MLSIRKWLHMWFPRHFCSRDSPIVFISDEIRCPVCDRLLAYRYPATKGKGYAYEVHVCYPEFAPAEKVFAVANRDPPPVDPDPYGIENTIALIHQRPDEEPLLSDAWELDESCSLPQNNNENDL